MLFKIENGQMLFIYEVFKKLVVGLGIFVLQLFILFSKGQVNGCMVVIKMGIGQEYLMMIYEYMLLVDQLIKKQMLLYYVCIWVCSMDEFDGWVCYDGEEFLYVLIGMIKLFIEFYELVEMCCGDSVYYDVIMGYNVVLISDEDVIILWVMFLSQCLDLVLDGVGCV